MVYTQGKFPESSKSIREKKCFSSHPIVHSLFNIGIFRKKKYLTRLETVTQDGSDLFTYTQVDLYCSTVFKVK